MRKKSKTKDFFWNAFKILLALGILIAGVAFIWVSTFTIPDLNSFANRQVEQSTKIYDRTGEIVLYDLNEDVRRTKVPLEDISPNLIEATIAIEDSNFYNHYGIEPSAILRATLTNIRSLAFEQGGSTITQQVVKNTLLTPKKTISRKLKEWILAIRIDSQLEKDEILEIYMNETPYGGRVYGAEEAADRYFGKSSSDLSIAESAYLAALPQAPTYFWNNRDALENRKNKVLAEMRNNAFISDDELKAAQDKEVTFLNQGETSIRAPHFVFYIRAYLEEQYGSTAIERRGLKVVTTLDYEFQQEAERILSEYGAENTERFNAKNAALVAVDPKTGQIISMVGSREYDNEEIQGNFNGATASRQPGSSFKPFIYATALNQGYTDATVVFDLPTQFSARCEADDFTSDDGCFSPGNYDSAFRGPISLRDALAQSVNVPAVKTFYLAGMEESLDLAGNMGITTLDAEPDQYGLSLVLGSGEVRLLDITSAYGVFANNGVRNPHTGIMQIEDAEGEVLEEFEEAPEQVLSESTARMMNDMLSDNAARTPSFGPNSPLHFPNHDVAVKTGTTNNFLDLWTIGYSPNIAVGIWTGNNDNEPVDGEVAGFVVAPMWQEFMQFALDNIEENESFNAPESTNYESLKPILQGEWRGGYLNNEGRLTGGVHNILHWVDKNDPQGPIPSNPESDDQYDNWEYSVRQWVEGGGFSLDNDSEIAEPEVTDDADDADYDEIDLPEGEFINLTTSLQSSYGENDEVEVVAENNGELGRLELYVNNEFVDDDDSQPFSVSFDIDEVESINTNNINTLLIRGFSNSDTLQEIEHTFSVSD